MDLEKMKREFWKEDLIVLNQLLKDNSLSKKDKNNIFYIAYYIVGESTGYFIHNERIINLFNKFCQDNKQKSCFSEILEIMKNEIERVEYLSNREDLPKENQEDLHKKISPYELKKELIGRLYTTIEVANELNNHDIIFENNFYEIIKMLLFCKMDFEQNHIIPKIVQNESLINQYDKMKIAIDVVIRTNIGTHIGNGFDIEKCIINIITEKDVLSFDNDNYRKVVELAMYNIQSIVLDYALKQNELTPSKKIILIDYLDYMMKKYLPEYLYVPQETAQKFAENIIFKVAFSERLLSMDDKTYKETLEKIKDSNKPFSYAEIEASDKLTNEQRKFVISLIENGQTREKGLEREFTPSTNKPNGDYKQNIASAAVSQNALKLPSELYKKVMIIMDEICQKTEDAYHKEINEKYSQRYLEQYHRYRTKQQSILELLNNQAINSIERLYETIEKINSDYLTGKAREFSINEMSTYYKDDEFKKAISLLQLAEGSYFSYEAFDLLTNKNIPFMEDKNSLIEKALFLIDNQRMSRDSISEYFKCTIKELNEKGTYNMNMSLIFDGIDEEIIKNVAGNEPITVKKLIKEQKAN